MAHPTSRTLNETLRQDVPSDDAKTRKSDATPGADRSNTLKYFENLKTDKEGRLWVNSDVLVQRLDAIEGLLSQLLQELHVQNSILAQGLNVNADTL